MTVKVLLALCVLSVVLVSDCLAGWQNQWDKHHLGTCENGNYIRRLMSEHDNRKEDRIWEVICGRSSNLAANQNCDWTDYVNEWDQPVVFTCSGDRLLSGMQSDHWDRREDRRFRFRCCGVAGRKPSNCAWSGYANDWDREMNFAVSSNQVMTGAFSFHDDRKEDRRWRFMLCDI